MYLCVWCVYLWGVCVCMFISAWCVCVFGCVLCGCVFLSLCACVHIYVVFVYMYMAVCVCIWCGCVCCVVAYPWVLNSVVLVAQSCLTLCDLTDCSLPGFSLHGILQARILATLAEISDAEVLHMQGDTLMASCWVLKQQRAIREPQASNGQCARHRLGSREHRKGICFPAWGLREGLHWILN